jgi:hypothetical protein
MKGLVVAVKVDKGPVRWYAANHAPMGRPSGFQLLSSNEIWTQHASKPPSDFRYCCLGEHYESLPNDNSWPKILTSSIVNGKIVAAGQKSTRRGPSALKNSRLHEHDGCPVVPMCKQPAH